MIWPNVAKLTLKQTYLNSKPWKKNLVCIHSNISTAKITTKWAVTIVCSGNIDLILTSTVRSLRSFKKSKLIQFTQVWVGQNNKFKKPQNLFVKFL